MSKLPYWRWWRYVKRRRATSPGSIAAKPWNGMIGALALIGLLVGFDQWSKAQFVTADWAWHIQPSSWMIRPILMIVIAMPFMLFTTTRLFAAFSISGTLGNLVSELRYDAIANPIQVQRGTTYIAFNMADVWLVVALVLAVLTALSLLWTTISSLRRRPCETSETRTTTGASEDSLASQSA